MALLREECFSKNWNVKPLGEVVDFLDNLRRPVKSEDRVEGEYNYYGANGLQGTINDFLFDEPLILLAEDGGHFGNSERDIAYIAKGKYWVNNHAHVLKPKAGLELDFLYRVLQRYDVTKYIKGATRAKLTKGDAAMMPIPLPPLDEQKRIAAILDKADAIRRKRQQAIKLADDFLRAVFLDMFGDVSKFDLIKIKEIASKSRYSLSSGPFGSSLTSKHYVDDGVIVLRGTNVTSGRMDLSDVRYISEDKAQELKRSVIYPRDVVVVAVGASGRALSIPDDMPPAVMSQNFNKVTPDVDKVNPTYLEYCFNSTLVQRQFAQNTTDTVRTFLSLSKIKEVNIPVPPISLQRKFEEIFEETKCQITKINNTSLTVDSLFSSLSQKAFSGEL